MATLVFTWADTAARAREPMTTTSLNILKDECEGLVTSRHLLYASSYLVLANSPWSNLIMWIVLFSMQASVFKWIDVRKVTKKMYIMSRGSYCTNFSHKYRKDGHPYSVKCSIFLLPLGLHRPSFGWLIGWSVGLSLFPELVSESVRQLARKLVSQSLRESLIQRFSDSVIHWVRESVSQWVRKWLRKRKS